MRITRPDWKQLWSNVRERTTVDPEKLAIATAGTVMAAVAVQPLAQAIDVVSSPPRTDLSHSIVTASPECAQHPDTIEFKTADGTKIRATMMKAWETRGRMMDPQLEADLCTIQRSALPQVTDLPSRSVVAQTKVALRMDDDLVKQPEIEIDRNDKNAWVKNVSALMQRADQLDKETAAAETLPKQVEQERNDIGAALPTWELLKTQHPTFAVFGPSTPSNLWVEAETQKPDAAKLAGTLDHRAKDAHATVGVELEEMLRAASPTWTAEHGPSTKSNPVVEQTKAELAQDLRERVAAGQSFEEINKAIEGRYLNSAEHRAYHLDETVRAAYAPHLGPYQHQSLKDEIQGHIDAANQMRDEQMAAGKLDLAAIEKTIGDPGGSVEVRKSWSAAADPAAVLPSELRQIAPSLSYERAVELTPHLNAAMTEAKMAPGRERAAFIAQLSQESVEFRYFEEIASGAAYEWRLDLGNTHPGDGVRYKGRGPIQLTGRANYRAAGQALGIDLEGNPHLASRTDVGFRVAAWFWSSHGIGGPARAGDFNEVTRRINGGYNGLQVRIAYYETALQVIG